MKGKDLLDDHVEFYKQCDFGADTSTIAPSSDCCPTAFALRRESR